MNVNTASGTCPLAVPKTSSERPRYNASQSQPGVEVRQISVVPTTRLIPVTMFARDLGEQFGYRLSVIRNRYRTVTGV